MDLEGQVTSAIVAELQRQAEASDGKLQIGAENGGKLIVHGEIGLDELAMVIVGSVAGGP